MNTTIRTAIHIAITNGINTELSVPVIAGMMTKRKINTMIHTLLYAYINCHQ